MEAVDSEEAEEDCTFAVDYRKEVSEEKTLKLHSKFKSCIFFIFLKSDAFPLASPCRLCSSRHLLLAFYLALTSQQKGDTALPLAFVNIDR